MDGRRETDSAEQSEFSKKPRLFKKPWFEAPPRTHSKWRLCLQPDFPEVTGYSCGQDRKPRRGYTPFFEQSQKTGSMCFKNDYPYLINTGSYLKTLSRGWAAFLNPMAKADEALSPFEGVTGMKLPGCWEKVSSPRPPSKGENAIFNSFEMASKQKTAHPYTVHRTSYTVHRTSYIVNRTS